TPPFSTPLTAPTSIYTLSLHDALPIYFPSVGLLAREFPEGFVRYYKLDLVKMQTEFKPGIMIDLKPFPGTFAVGVDPSEPDAKAGPPIRDARGRTSTLRPWKNGPNMDL